jgi:hypothetical protein
MTAEGTVGAPTCFFLGGGFLGDFWEFFILIIILFVRRVGDDTDEKPQTGHLNLGSALNKCLEIVSVQKIFNGTII